MSTHDRDSLKLERDAKAWVEGQLRIRDRYIATLKERGIDVEKLHAGIKSRRNPFERERAVKSARRILCSLRRMEAQDLLRRLEKYAAKS